MSETRVTTKEVLMKHIERDWSALNRLLDGLNGIQWTDIRNADGWAIKDHVAHLTAWENSVIAVLHGKPQHEGLEVTEALYEADDLDAINRAIFHRHQHDSLAQVRDHFQSTHHELLDLVAQLSDVDLNRPYSHYVPGRDTPVINVIYGNTAHHYREHQAWIEAMLVAAAD